MKRENLDGHVAYIHKYRHSLCSAPHACNQEKRKCPSGKYPVKSCSSLLLACACTCLCTTGNALQQRRICTRGPLPLLRLRTHMNPIDTLIYPIVASWRNLLVTETTDRETTRDVIRVTSERVGTMNTT